MTANQIPNLKYLNLDQAKAVYYQSAPAELIELAICNKEGTLTENGALAIDTGKFTGRSPKDRFIVADEITEDTVCWGDVNIRISPDKFEKLFQKVTQYLTTKEIYVRDAYVCADPTYQLSLRVITETAFQGLFAHNLFLRPDKVDPKQKPEWTILSASGFNAIPSEDGTRKPNFVILNFSKKIILIGGTAYTGEIKKGIFSVLNFLLPQQHRVLSMHCSANMGQGGDVAIFFGLSGTGKTTLSADPERNLIGDDEHGWSETSIFNFEGGCYAKCANLSSQKESELFNAIKFGSLLENTVYYKDTRSVDFSNITKTENTRVAYPIYYIEHAIIPSIASPPRNIFFLTADAFGIFPPIAKLTTEQAMYYFISGYTAKVAGTETGIVEPKATFSACFGQVFMPLHPAKYAELLGEKMKEHNANVWLVNTGWTGGPYGVGSRMDLALTRAMITAAMKEQLSDVAFEEHPIFGFMMPVSCPGVPAKILNPRNTWIDKEKYDQKALDLAKTFVSNFDQFAKFASDAVKFANSHLGIH